MRFADLQHIDSLVHNVWDATALFCLEDHALRYTDLGSQMSEWSGQRLSDSTVTQTVKRLFRAGMVETIKDNDGARTVSRYALTDAGRARLAKLRVLQSAGAAARTEARPPHATRDGATHGIARQSTSADDSTMAWDDRDPGGAQEPVDGSANRFDIFKPHPARRYNYWLGGKDHYPADRQSAAEIEKVMPSVVMGARENRKFQRRVVRFLAAEAGIRQFLDIGTGLPAPDNTHEVAQAIDPTSRIVYVDNDPLVLANARALLTGTSEGRTAYIDADLREPEKILGHPDLRGTLDLDQPVALLLIAVLHFIVDDEDPYGLVARLLGKLAPGSYVAITNVTQDFMPAEQVEVVNAAASTGRHGQVRFRSAAELGQFFEGTDLVPPGICSVADWQRDESPPPPAADVSCLGGVARVP
ncbi:hypothetical protein GCM10009557_01140 [Virgisporangium ochraceum]|uniref:S-adenosyl methyltransferase n=1 Tax=Virgisporangium ochraceum TaxID=65505 RepID=A0A8J4A5E3_9ACTN|nr:SAM-dependent methyltransferase [Virgisporangium ochraceum]GIJ74145.1 hypothetical protein Voc01_090620 [Virgisporangium ochraceum]